MLNAYAAFMLPDVLGAATFDPPPAGASFDMSRVHRAWGTADGHVVMMIIEDHQFQGLCRAVGREDLIADPRFATLIDRLANLDAVLALAEEELRKWPTAELVERARRFGAPLAPVNDVAAFLQDPQVAASGAIVAMEDAQAGPMRFPREPGAISGNADELSSPAAAARGAHRRGAGGGRVRGRGDRSAADGRGGILGKSGGSGAERAAGVSDRPGGSPLTLRRRHRLDLAECRLERPLHLGRLPHHHDRHLLRRRHDPRRHCSDVRRGHRAYPTLIRRQLVLGEPWNSSSAKRAASASGLSTAAGTGRSDTPSPSRGPSRRAASAELAAHGQRQAKRLDRRRALRERADAEVAAEEAAANMLHALYVRLRFTRSSSMRRDVKPPPRIVLPTDATR
jgi:hypothetical protein